MNYDQVMYGHKPMTDYPEKLTEYLIDRFLDKYPERHGSSMLDVAPGRGEFRKAFEKFGMDLDKLAQKQFASDEILPWEHLGGPDKESLLGHLEKAMKEVKTIEN